MSRIQAEVLIHANAEYLAKENDFAAENLLFYIEQARQYHVLGSSAGFITAAQESDVKVHEFMIVDDEAAVLALRPELTSIFKESDENQLRSAKDWRSLDHFLANGIEYTFDESKRASASSLLVPDQPISKCLIREKIVNLNGFDVRVNYMYHDILDHVWFFEYVRAIGLADRYADYFNSVGLPFNGFLFSRQAELISTVGFSARQYLSKPDYYNSIAMDIEVITEHMLSGDYKDDIRVLTAVQKLNNDPQLALFAGFVIKGDVASMLNQRRKFGAIKGIVFVNNHLVESGRIVPLLDPRYIAFIIDGLDGLKNESTRYANAQKNANLAIEVAIRQFIEKGQLVGKIIVGQAVDTSEMRLPSNIEDQLTSDLGLSTSYY